MFADRANYEKPVIKNVNKKTVVAIYFPTVKGLDAIVAIKNLKSGQEIALYSNTLVNISSSFIEEVLSNSYKFFFNKRITKKTDKKGNKKRKK